MSGRSLTRTVTLGKRSRSVSASSKWKKQRVPIPRALALRGTPKGEYIIVRTAVGSLSYTNVGMTIGAAGNNVGATFVFTGPTISLVAGTGVNQNDYTVPNFTEIAALFDRVMLDKVEITFMTSVSGAANSGTQQPLFLFAEDPNDTPTSPDQIKQMDCVTWFPGNQTTGGVFKKTVRPQYLSLTYFTALVSSYSPQRGFVNSDTAIPHYGLKIGIDPLNASGSLNMTFKVTYRCKNLK